MDYNFEWILRSEKFLASPMTVVVACDPLYLRFAKALIRSIDFFSPGYDVVLVVINPSSGDHADLQALAEQARRTSVSIVAQTINVKTWSLERRRAYYACARFLVLPEILRGAPCPVICIDADSLVVNPLKPALVAETENPDIALWRRDLETSNLPDNLKVAAGVVAFFNTEAALVFAEKLSASLAEVFETGTGAWYVDQVLLSRLITEMAETVKASNLNARFKDFGRFKTWAVIWSAKGDTKEFGEPFVALSKIFSDSSLDKAEAKHVLRRAAIRAPKGSVDNFFSGHTGLTKLLPRTGTVYLPRLDLPWKPFKGEKAPVLTDDTLRIRLHWKEFAILLANTLEAEGIRMEVKELPAWEITSERVNATSGDLAFLPHLSRFQIKRLAIPSYFYMQEYLPWLFSVDVNGWGAASSVYPVSNDWSSFDAGNSFAHYKDMLQQGRLGTKFSQAVRKEGSELGEGFDIFFPLQIPTDQVIRFHSDVSLPDALEAVCDFARAENLRLVLKPHPANRKSTMPFKQLADNVNVFWSEDNFHDIILLSRSVFTINSSVGFEAMLHEKPIVTFGRTPYDTVTIKTTPNTISQAWEKCRMWSADDANAYRAFVSWYCEHYAVDLSRTELRKVTLLNKVQLILDDIYGDSGKRAK